MALIRFKRGTRAELDAAAAANELTQAEPYYITDDTDAPVAIGSGVDSYVDFNIGNWDAAFSWGDHAVAGYGLLGSTNNWAQQNTFENDNLIISNSGINATQTTLSSLATSTVKSISFPDASGTVALLDDIPTVPDVIDDLSDVTTTSVSDDHVLFYDRGDWVNRPITESDISDLGNYGVLGTGSGEVRTNTQLDGRYGRLTSSNEWTQSNVFGNGQLRFDASGVTSRVLIASLSQSRDWTLPDATGTIALTDDLLEPGGNTNQLQVNDGSGGLAGIPVTQSDLALLGSTNNWTELNRFRKSGEQIVREPPGGSTSRITERVDELGSGAGSAADNLNWGSNVTHIMRFRTTGSTAGDNVRGIAWTRFDNNLEMAVDMDAGGVVVGSPAGGFQGTGVFNAEGVQVDGVDVLKVGDFGLGNTDIPTSLDSVTDIRTQAAGLYRVGSIASSFSTTFGVGAGPVFLGSFNADQAAGLMIRPTEADRAAFIFGQSTASDQWAEELWHSGNLPFTVSGNDIGLGATPTERLDVDGNIRVRGNILQDANVHALTDVTSSGQTRTIDFSTAPEQTISANQNFTLNASGEAGKIHETRLYVYNNSEDVFITFGSGFWAQGDIVSLSGAVDNYLLILEWGSGGAVIKQKHENSAVGDQRPT